jgi:hypothetical protein
MLVISVLVITIAIWRNDGVRSYSECLPRASSHVCNGTRPMSPSPPDSRAVGNDSGVGHGCCPTLRPSPREVQALRRSGGPLTAPARSAGESRREKLGVPPQCSPRRPHLRRRGSRASRAPESSERIGPAKPLPDACRRARFRQAMRAYHEEHCGLAVLAEVASPGTLFGGRARRHGAYKCAPAQRSGTPKRCL